MFLDYLLSKYGLLDIVQSEDALDPFKVAVTFDGGSVNRFLGHVTGGFKLVDKGCIHPITGEPLFSDSGIEKVQSHVHCFPIKIAFAKDTKDFYQLEYRDFIEFLRCMKGNITTR